MEMPESCDKCPCFHGYYSDMCCGVANNRGIDYPYPKDFRQRWCPLKPLPEEEVVEDLLDEYGDGWTDGWNAFREAILED